jgi:stearoyl-CoA desaturase (delta-9 desaturase)
MQYVQTLVPLAALIFAAVQAFMHGVSVPALATCIVFYSAAGLGITLGWHRLFTHRSFATIQPIRTFLAIAGSMANQGTLFSWVAVHRKHHQSSDCDGDPHSPYSGESTILPKLAAVYHGHIGWMLSFRTSPELCSYIPDLLADEWLSRVQRLHLVWVALGIVIPSVICWAITGTLFGALEGALWGGLVRIALTNQITWAVNSICHLWGTQPFDSGDQSRNNVVVALLSLGEGWHNNHHAFPSSARHGLRWWQVDFGYLVLVALSKCGVVWDIKTPSKEQQLRRAVAT